MSLSGNLFMDAGRPVFAEADAALYALRDEADHILVDMHAEATSEKVGMGWYLDGRVTAVVGTHTHVPTADARVLPGGTAYITDVGMTGPRGGRDRRQARAGDRGDVDEDAGPLRDLDRGPVAQRGADHRRRGADAGGGDRGGAGAGGCRNLTLPSCYGVAIWIGIGSSRSCASGSQLARDGASAAGWLANSATITSGKNHTMYGYSQ